MSDIDDLMDNDIRGSVHDLRNQFGPASAVEKQPRPVVSLVWHLRLEPNENAVIGTAVLDEFTDELAALANRVGATLRYTPVKGHVTAQFSWPKQKRAKKR